ncbi:MAG: hypothetical protein CMJ68_10180 [Planctomycetaceae bacterium]|nr:hypothetical protein [Planctomycetaceae bacterium]
MITGSVLGDAMRLFGSTFLLVAFNAEADPRGFVEPVIVMQKSAEKLQLDGLPGNQIRSAFSPR